MTDPTSQIIHHIAETDFSSFSPRLLEKTKVFILDSLAAIIAGSSAVGISEVIDQILDWGGKPEAKILVYGGRVPGHLAALANSMMCHARELDDVHEEASVHVNASVLPAALAASQIKGGVGGRELLKGVVIGCDLTCRLGLSIRHLRGWHFSAICGGIGAAAAAARVLGFDAHEIHNTIGIAYAQLSGNARSSTEGVMTKRLNPGFVARNALFAAGLAKRGISGPKCILNGKEGFFNLFDGHGISEDELRYRLDGTPYDRKNLVKDLGLRFEGEFLSMKRYPSCRFTHAPIDAALLVASEADIDPESVSRIEVRVCKRAMKYANHFIPGENPEISAQFSIPYTVAVALTHRRVFLDSFTRDAVQDRRVLDLAAKVEVLHDPRIKLKVPVTIVVETMDGSRFERTIHQISGSTESDLSLEDATNKLAECLSWSARTYTKSRAQQLVEMIADLEQLDEIQKLIDLMVPI
jgi:2-methylcitrate dehydratase PrpD